MNDDSTELSQGGGADRARPSPSAPRRSDRASGVLLALSMLAAFALVLRTIHGIATGPLPPRAGAEAPPFSAKTPDGAGVQLGDYRGKVVLVDFWATWCPPCVASMPALERIHADFASRGFSVLGVNQEAGEEAWVRRFLDTNGITFPTVMDDGTIARQFGVFSFPTSFLIGPNGEIRQMYQGVASESRLRRDVEAVLTSTSARAARDASDVEAFARLDASGRDGR